MKVHANKHKCLITAVCLLAIVCSLGHAEASLTHVLRQSGESEQEATTAKTETTNNNNNNNNNNGAQTNRLYPDVPQQPNFLPPFNGVSPHHYPAISHHHGQTPFTPFGLQVPASRLNADQQPVPFGRVLPQPRPMTPADRLQSQSFANGLGRRLLSMIGINPSNDNNNNNNTNSDAGATTAADQRVPSASNNMPTSNGGPLDALQNSTVLQQLNRGVNSIYGGLSKMYNSTIQDQLNLLQERFKSETQNSTNPWHQRMAEQVPQFFKQMAARVGDAQENLNKIWQDVTQASQGNSTILNRSANQGSGQPRSGFFSSFDHFMNGNPNSHDFFNNIGRQFGFGNNNNMNQPQTMALQSSMQNSQQQQQQQPDLASQLREFWHMQVQPQIGMVRQQMSRAWRDLTSSGAFNTETIMRSRVNSQGGAQNSSSNPNLIDEVLKEVDMNGSEYSLVESKDDASAPENRTTGDNAGPGIQLSPQMQNRLIAAQRELNQLWMGLTNSLQSAITNVKNTVNPPRRQFANTLDAMASNNREQMQNDPAVTEIDGKVRDLSKLQRDADMVYDTVQQQQRDAQQRQSFGDRFVSFFNNMNVDLSNVNQLPDRIGQQFNRFGTAVGDLWNQIPERWDNFMQNMKPQQNQRDQANMMAKLQAPVNTPSTSTTTPSSTTEK